MPRGVKKILEIQKSRTLEGRASRTLAEQRIKGDAPALGLLERAQKKKLTKKKPALKKTNSKGEVIKGKAKAPYKVLIKRCLKENHSRKGTTTQAIVKYIVANFGDCNNVALRRALLAASLDGRLNRLSSGHRWSLSASEKKGKKAKKSKSLKKKTKKSTKKSEKKSAKKSKSDKKPKSTKKSKVAKEKAPKKSVSKAPKKAVSKAPKTASVTRGVPKSTTAPSVSTTTTTTTTPTSASSGENVWVWQFYDNGFHNYDIDASNTVEGVYQEYLKSPFTCDVRAVKSGQWQYEIDFRVMTQTNIQHESHTQRRIRRIQIPASERGNKQKNYGGDEKYEHVSEKKNRS